MICRRQGRIGILKGTGKMPLHLSSFSHSQPLATTSAVSSLFFPVSTPAEDSEVYRPKFNEWDQTARTIYSAYPCLAPEAFP